MLSNQNASRTYLFLPNFHKHELATFSNAPLKKGKSISYNGLVCLLRERERASERESNRSMKILIQKNVLDSVLLIIRWFECVSLALAKCISVHTINKQVQTCIHTKIKHQQWTLLYLPLSLLNCEPTF